MWYVACLWFGALVGFGIAGLMCASGRASEAERRRGYMGPKESKPPTKRQIPTIREGKVRKGGVNRGGPTRPRPSPPPGQEGSS